MDQSCGWFGCLPKHFAIRAAARLCQAYPGFEKTEASTPTGFAWLCTWPPEEGWQVLQMLNPADQPVTRVWRVYKLSHIILPPTSTPTLRHRPRGWSIYTGAASWYFRVIYEELLGLTLKGDSLFLTPRLPSAWNRAELKAQIKGTGLTLCFERGKEPGLFLGGRKVEKIPLDGGEYTVRVVFV